MNHEHEHDDGFEHDLRRGLSALAAGCPAGPSGDAVLARLHQRTRRRRIAAASACAAACAVAVAVIALQQPHSQPVAPPVNQVKVDPAAPAQPETAKAPAPLPPQPRETVASLLNLREPAGSDPVAIAVAQPVEIDWNLTLTLSLASHVSENPVTSLRFDSPAWR